MNPFQKLYHWIHSNILIFFNVRPLLKAIGLELDFKVWDKLIEKRDIEGVQAFVTKLVDLAQKDILGKRDKQDLEFYAFLTYGYSLWLMNSKRVYAPSPTLVSMLLQTELPPFKVGEIQYVFDSFAIQLEEPIIAPSGAKHNLLLVSIEPDAIFIASINDNVMSKFLPFQKGVLEQLLLDIRSKDKGKRCEALRQIREGLFFQSEESAGLTYTFTTSPNRTYLECIQDFEEAITNGWSDALRLIIGLNLYLQSDDRSHRTQGKALREGLSTVGMEGHAESVDLVELAVSRSDLWDQVIEVQKGTRGPMVGVHVRMGHWRRWEKGVLVNYPDGHKKWIKPTIAIGRGVISKETLLFRGMIKSVDLRPKEAA